MQQQVPDLPSDAPPAFAEFVERHQREVYAYLRARSFDHGDAERLTRNVFLQLLQTGKVPEDVSTASAALIEIAQRLLREHIRKSRRNDRRHWTELCLELDALPVEEPGSIGSSPTGGLSEHVAALNSSARQALELRYTANMPLAEIAVHLKRSQGAVVQLLQHARESLRQSLVSRTPDSA